MMKKEKRRAKGVFGLLPWLGSVAEEETKMLIRKQTGKSGIE